MAEDVTPETIEAAYFDMWENKCKGGTIYRDGSRSNQVLKATGAANGDYWRDVLDDERPGIIHKFQVGEVEGYAHIGVFDDGQPAELFLDVAREGTSLSGFADWVGQLTSLSWQLAHKHDVPFTVFTDKWIGRTFEPYGFTKNDEIPKADSIADYLGQYLNKRFADGNPPVQVQNGNICPTPDCGTLLVHSEGCAHCPSCGYEKC